MSQQNHRILPIVFLGVLLAFTIYGAYTTIPEFAPALEWSRTYGQEGNMPLAFIELTSDGGYIFGGVSILANRTASVFLIMKTDAAGNVQWNRTLVQADEMSFSPYNRHLTVGTSSEE